MVPTEMGTMIAMDPTMTDTVQTMGRTMAQTMDQSTIGMEIVIEPLVSAVSFDLKTQQSFNSKVIFNRLRSKPN